jgi:hypothetical protein
MLFIVSWILAIGFAWYYWVVSKIFDKNICIANNRFHWQNSIL